MGVSEPPHTTILIQADAIAARVMALAAEIAQDYAGRELHLVGVMRGALYFLADLSRALQAEDAGALTFDWIELSSYRGGTESTGNVEVTRDLIDPVDGRHVLVIEDIVDSGHTMTFLVALLQARGAATVEVCALLDKPARRRAPNLQVRYIGFRIEDQFVLGYGMDLDERHRALPYIAVVAAKPE